MPFVPDRLSIAGIGLRLAAYLVDLALMYPISLAFFGLIMLYHQGQFMETLRFRQQHKQAIAWLERIVWVLYFAILEGLAGASVGKWLMRLRVNRVARGGPPGLGRGLARTLAFYAVTGLPADVLDVSVPVHGLRDSMEYWVYDRGIRFWVYDRVIRGLGLLALFTTMRKASGFRGPHEWLSGTRVVQVVPSRRPRPTYRLQALAGSQVGSEVSGAAPRLLDRVGPYVVHGTIRWEPQEKILLGEDSTLKRPVWIVLGEPETEPPEPARRSLSRQSRPRWIGGGDCEQGRWDAFTAPAGVPLADLVSTEGLPWSDVLPLIRQLAAELRAARDDGTLPHGLTVEQVWVQPDGSVQLIDLFQRSENRTKFEPADDTRLLAFLGEMARLALEGRPQDGRSGKRLQSRKSQVPGWLPAGWGRRIRAAVPERAGSDTGTPRWRSPSIPFARRPPRSARCGGRPAHRDQRGPPRHSSRNSGILSFARVIDHVRALGHFLPG